MVIVNMYSYRRGMYRQYGALASPLETLVPSSRNANTKTAVIILEPFNWIVMAQKMGVSDVVPGIRHRKTMPCLTNIRG